LAYDGAGTFNRLHNFQADRDAGIKIRADRMDNELDGVATGLTTAITKDGQTTITANLPMAGFRHTGVGTASARNHYGVVSQIQDGAYVHGTAAGSANVLTLNVAPSLTAYTTGLRLTFKGASANTSAATLNVDAVGAKAIRKRGDAALVANDILANGIYSVVYDAAANSAAGAWILENPSTYARTGEAETVSGAWTFTGDPKIQSATPRLILSETDAAVDNKDWIIQLSSQTLRIQALTDAGSGGGDLFNITRSAQQLATLEFGNTSSPVFKADETTDTLTSKGNTIWHAGNSGNAALSSFRAHKNGTDQTGIASATATKLTFATESFDVGSHYNTTNSRWTPPAGKVRISAAAVQNGGVDGEVVQLMIYKNGVEFARDMRTPGASGTSGVAVTVSDSASGTDFYEVYFQFSGAGTRTVNGGSWVTWFSGEMI
jgi:hypothetical protein